MLDPLSALSAASAILGLLDFSSKVVGTAHEIYSSAHSLPIDQLEIKDVTEKLKSLSTRLAETTATPVTNLSAAEQDLQSIAKACAEIAETLIQKLERLQKKQNTRWRSWRSLQQAFKAVWNEGEIENVQKRLDRARSSLTVHLLEALRTQTSSATMSLNKLLQTASEIQTDLPTQINEAKTQLISVLQGLTDRLPVARVHLARPDIVSELNELIEWFEGKFSTTSRLQSLPHLKQLAARLNVSNDLVIDVEILERLLEKLANEVAGIKVLDNTAKLELRALKIDAGDIISEIQKLIRAARTEPIGLLSAMDVLEKSKQVSMASVLRQLEQFSEILESMCHSSKELSIITAIIGSLHFQEMPMRHVQIPDSYGKTNSWILEQTESPLRAWLEADGSPGVFWLNGKAGSGKSTLVKFVADHPATHEILQRWADASTKSAGTQQPRRLAVVSYYFWRSGYPLQKSVAGLFRGLLYNIFKKFPEAIRTVCASRWNELSDGPAHHTPDPWTSQELSKCMTTVLSLEGWPTNFCFFIDGLDEYHGTSNEQYDLVQDLTKLAASTVVKICVSSRPWNVFRTAFENGPHVVLQDHNAADMDSYIAGKLEGDSRFQRLADIDKRTSAFAIEIRERANGVFLWVFLVIRSLLDGLTEDDDIAMLQERLRALPPTLEQFFELMLKSIDPIYRQYTARALLLACNATHPLPMLSYYYLRAEISDPDYSIKAPVQSSSAAQVEKRQKDVLSWINKWCRDLLEVRQFKPEGDFYDPTQKHRVEFLHRSVRDYLTSEDAQARFEKDAGRSFNPRLSLCRSYLTQIKDFVYQPTGHDAHAIAGFPALAGYVMHHAREHEVVDGKSPVQILNELNRVGHESFKTMNAKHWTVHCCPSPEKLTQTFRKSDFVAYAVEFNLQLYVCAFLDAESRTAVREKQAWRLLDSATDPYFEHPTLPSPREPLESMAHLLENYIGGSQNSAINHVPHFRHSKTGAARTTTEKQKLLPSYVMENNAMNAVQHFRLIQELGMSDDTLDPTDEMLANGGGAMYHLSTSPSLPNLTVPDYNESNVLLGSNPISRSFDEFMKNRQLSGSVAHRLASFANESVDLEHFSSTQRIGDVESNYMTQEINPEVEDWHFDAE